MLKVEHIGIAVKTLADSVPLFEKLLKSQCYKTEAVESERVNTAFFKTGDTKIELLESIDENGVIAKFIEKKGWDGIELLSEPTESLMKYYKIEGIPRFMIFDKEGKIVTVDAPRPSNPEFKSLIEQTLESNNGK